MAAPSIQTNVLHGTVLERYTNELRMPEGFKAPVLATDYEWKAKLWNTVANVTFIAYTILSASIILATGILAPNHGPLSCICTQLCFNTVEGWYAKFRYKSKQYKASAEQLKAVALHYQQLQQITTQSDLQDIVNNLLVKSNKDGKKATFYYPSGPRRGKGIFAWDDISHMKENPENLKTLKPAIAWFRFWKEHIETLKKNKESALVRAAFFGESDASCSKNRDEIHRLQIEAFEINKEILESKIRKAFAFLIVVQPNVTTPLEEIGDFSNFPEEMRLVAEEAVGSDTHHNKLFKFKDKTALTFSDVRFFKTRSLSGVTGGRSLTGDLFEGLPISEQSFA